MADKKEDLPVEPTEAPKTDAQQAVEQKPEPQGGEGEEFDQERAMALIKKLREGERDFKKAQKRLAELEAEDAKRKEAELTETQKLQKQLADMQAKNVAAERALLVQKIAAETGIPPALADRLQGADEDELREDAKKILELIIKTPKPKIDPTLPAGGQKPETDSQKRERLLNPQGNDPFSIEGAKKMGGGVTYFNNN